MQIAMQNDPKRRETRALRYILDAWEDAIDDGVRSEQLVCASLFAALSELVADHGETAVAGMMGNLGERIEGGEFTLGRTLQ